MIIQFKENKFLANDINRLLQEACILHNNIYEKDVYDILKKYPDSCVEPEYNIYNPRRGWGWTWSSLRYFAEIDEFSAYLPNSNKIDKDALDELRSEDLCIRANKTDILESVGNLKSMVDIIDQGGSVFKRDFKDELNKLENLIKGE